MRNAVAALPILLALLAPAQVSPRAHSQGRISGILLYPDGTPVIASRTSLSMSLSAGKRW
jgi:hypothetical protein